MLDHYMTKKNYRRIKEIQVTFPEPTSVLDINLHTSDWIIFIFFLFVNLVYF